LQIKRLRWENEEVEGRMERRRGVEVAGEDRNDLRVGTIMFS